MKVKFPFTAFDQYCLRTPLLPIDFFEELMAKNLVDRVLLEILKPPIIKEAIFLSSPELFSQLTKWVNGELVNQKRIERLRSSLLKFLIRMSTRCTPFGLFASCSTGVFGSETQILIDKASGVRKVTRFDMHFLVALSQFLAKKEHIKKQLKFFPNSTIYQIGNRYRYIEYSYVNNKRQHSLESVLHSDYLERILSLAKNGALIGSLIESIANQEIDQNSAEDYIDQLIDNQILISELEPTITGKSYLEQLLNTLKNLENCEEEILLLTELSNQLQNLDAQNAWDLNSYFNAEKFMSSLEIPFDPKYLFQTDSFNTLSSNSLSTDILKKVHLGVSFLNRFDTPLENEHLNKFKSAFLERYELERRPLLEVLDVETGIGYIQGANKVESTPFLDDILTFNDSSESPQKESLLTSQQRLLHRKLVDAISNDKNCIEFKDEDLGSFDDNWNNSPDTFSTMVEIISEDGINKVVINHCGAHASRLLARFCYGDSKLNNLVNSIVEKENQMNHDRILAEILHLPESRTGNILRRPHLRNFEIPCLGHSNLPQNQQIPLQDILIAVKKNEIVLYSKRLNKKIMPRLTNAHNYWTNSLHVYHFLCDLQYQKQRNYSFEWGNLASEYKFLPRVIYKDLILSKAQWRIGKKEFQDIVKVWKTNKRLISKVRLWRNSIHLPKVVQLLQRDNKLTLNLENSSSVKMLLDSIKNREEFILEEFLFKDSDIVKNNNERFANEVIVCFYKNDSPNN